MFSRSSSGIETGPELSLKDRLNQSLAIAGSILTLAGGTFVREAVLHPDKALAEQQCTTETTTTTDGTTTTTTETTHCTDTSDDSSDQQPSQPKPDNPDNPKGKPKPDKPHHGKSIHGPKTDKTDSQDNFPGYNMDDTQFTDGNGCFVTGEASALRRVTGDARITPRRLDYPELRHHWGPDEKGQGVHGFLFDDVLPKTAARYGVKVWPTDFRGAVKAIKMGDQVMMLAEPGHFTDAGHYMDAWKAHGNKLVIDDPNGKGKHGDSERPGGWSGSQLRTAGIIGYRVLHQR